MKAEEIKILLDKVYRPVCKIEEDLGMPKTTLQKAIKGYRALPKRWSIELKEYVKTSGWITANVKENNKPENKKRIEKERETVSEVSTKAKNPLTETEVVRHPLWKEGDPNEGTMRFYLKYDCYNYSELENKTK